MNRLVNTVFAMDGMKVLSLKRGSIYSGYSFFHLDGEFLQPWYTRAEERVDALNDAVQIIVFLRSLGSELHMQRANQAARVLWPKLRLGIRCQALN